MPTASVKDSELVAATLVETFYANVDVSSELQAKLPDEEVFFDGDSFAICSRPKRGR